MQYSIRMEISEQIFEIGSCMEIMANDSKINTTDQYMFYS